MLAEPAKARAAFVKAASIELGEAEDVLKHDLGRVLLKLEEAQEAEIAAVLAPEDRAGMSATPEKLLAVTPLIRERIKLMSEAVSAADFFFLDQLPPYDPAELIPQKGDAALAKRVLQTALEVLPNTAFDHDSLDQALRQAAASLGIKAGPMFQPIRVAVCGRKNAPPLLPCCKLALNAWMGLYAAITRAG